jgi:predicted lactoylglutathione lyase
MAGKIFVNLPVKNLNLSVEFFTKLGFTFNQQFTDETATCMIVTDDIFVMLLTEEKFKSFTPKEICDAKKYTEVLVCLSLESRQKSMRWFAKLAPPVVPLTMSRKTMVLCMDTGSRTWMATFGS